MESFLYKKLEEYLRQKDIGDEYGMISKNSVIRRMYLIKTEYDALLKAHGEGPCYICGKLKIEDSDSVCSYPHGMIPVARIADTDMWEWK